MLSLDFINETQPWEIEVQIDFLDHCRVIEEHKIVRILQRAVDIIVQKMT